ncbi:DUF551 domain-containing protein [Klebsiella pneumoniae]|nr:DUF551 domain-containing protein [Klebsiella pneumoniae]MCS6004609.1 DUF551 domain-containing protein [Klebsiella pneumoniae subsp. pneumoniae]
MENKTMTKSTITRDELNEVIATYGKHHIAHRMANALLAAMGSRPHTDDELSNLLWYSQEATCHSDPNYYCEFQRLATPGLIAGIIRELQERRKVDSEPVAWLLSGGGAKNVVCFDSGNAYADPLREVTPLYRHAQQPVVEREPIAWLNDAYLARGVVDGEAGSEDAGPGYIPVYREAGPHPAPVVPDERDKAVDADDHPLLWSFNEGWNACRSAMLAAAQQSPGSEPATVPGKWIPVSERMPEVGDIVLTAIGGVVNVGEMECSAANCRFFTSVISGRELPATHWMPLPAGPQGVKGE